MVHRSRRAFDVSVATRIPSRVAILSWAGQRNPSTAGKPAGHRFQQGIGEPFGARGHDKNGDFRKVAKGLLTSHQMELGQ